MNPRSRGWQLRWPASFGPHAVVLLAIFLVAAWLRFTGLMPNIQHPDEGYTEGNVEHLIQTGSLKPLGYKYGSIQFYANLAAVKTIRPVSLWLDKQLGGRLIPATLRPDQPGRAKELFITSWSMRGFSALIGSLTALLTYAIAIALYRSRAIGLVGASFVAVSPMHVRESHYITTDVLAIFLLYLSFLAVVKLWRRGAFRDYLLAGFLVGLAASVRYQPLGAVPLLAAQVLRQDRAARQFIWFLLAGVAGLLGFLAGSPTLPANLSHVRLDFAVNILPWYQPGLHHFNWWFVRELARIGTGYGVAVAAVGGALLGLLRQFAPTVLLLSVTLPIIVFIGAFIVPTWERLVMPAVPGLALLAASFLVWLLKASKKFIAPRSQTVALTLLTVILATPQLLTAGKASADCAKPLTVSAAYDWIGANLPTDRPIVHTIGVRMPEDKPYQRIAIERNDMYSIEEVRATGARYFVLNTEPLIRNFNWTKHGWIPDKVHGLTKYQYLALAEWETHTGQEVVFKQKFAKHELCGDYDIRVYELAPQEPAGTVAQVTNYDLTQPKTAADWQAHPQKDVELTEQGLLLNTQLNGSTTFLLIGPELALKPMRHHRIRFHYRLTQPQAPQVFAYGELASGQLFLAPQSRQGGQQSVTILIPAQPEEARVVPSFVANIQVGTTVVLERAEVEELTQ